MNEGVRVTAESISPRGTVVIGMNGRSAALPPETAHRGTCACWTSRLLALFCSNRCPGDLILKTYDLARAMRTPACRSLEASRRRWRESVCACCYGAASRW